MRPERKKKMKPFVKHLTLGVFCFCVFGWLSSAWAAGEGSTPDEVVHRVYLGELYPSGNLYLQRIGLESSILQNWPAQVEFACNADTPSASGFHAGEFSPAIFVHSTDVSPPGVEGMDEMKNQACHWSYHTSSSHEYLGSDYFYTVFDYCLPEKGLGQYHTTETVRKAFPVIAVETSLVPEGLNFSRRGNLRPLTPDEETKVNRSKEETRHQKDCTTVPRFLDDAKELARFRLKGKSTTVRVSSYENAGCLGHLEKVYVVDVFENDRLQKSYQLNHYIGPI
jgi:hypothetical protein